MGRAEQAVTSSGWETGPFLRDLPICPSFQSLISNYRWRSFCIPGPQLGAPIISLLRRQDTQHPHFANGDKKTIPSWYQQTSQGHAVAPALPATTTKAGEGEEMAISPSAPPTPPGTTMSPCGPRGSCSEDTVCLAQCTAPSLDISTCCLAQDPISEAFP